MPSTKLDEDGEAAAVAEETWHDYLVLTHRTMSTKPPEDRDVDGGLKPTGNGRAPAGPGAYHRDYLELGPQTADEKTHTASDFFSSQNASDIAVAVRQDQQRLAAYELVFPAPVCRCTLSPPLGRPTHHSRISFFRLFA